MTKNTQKLKIGFVLDDGLDSPDGVQQNILTLGQWFVSLGHEVHYLVGETKRTDIPNVHSMAKNVRVSFNGNKLTIPTYASKQYIRSIVEKENFDVLHVQMPYHPFCAARIIKAAAKGTVIVGTFHILEFNRITRIASRLLGIYLNRNLRNFDKFFSVSEPARIFARASFHIDSTILPNPISLAKFRPKQTAGHDSRQIKILFLGRLVSRKGCLQLLKALAYINKYSPANTPHHVDICGRGALQPSLEQFVQKHGLANIVTFQGFVSEGQKIKFMQEADIAVFPSYAGESFGIVLAEAMAADSGVVLGGHNPGYLSVLKSMPESLLDPHDTAGFAEILKQYIDSPLRRQRLHAKQQEIVEKFDVANVGGKLLTAYRDCIEASNDR